MDYNGLLGKLVYQFLLTEFKSEIRELALTYVTPQSPFALIGQSMEECTWSCPLNTSIKADTVDLTNLLLSNGQAQLSNNYDRAYLFNNLGTNDSDVPITLKMETNVSTDLERVMSRTGYNGLQDVSQTITKVDKDAGLQDGQVAYDRLKSKYSRMNFSVYSEQGRRIKPAKVNLGPRSSRLNVSAVVYGEVNRPLFVFARHNTDNYELLFFSHIVVNKGLPGHVVDILASEQCLFYLLDLMSGNPKVTQFSIPLPSYTNGYFQEKHMELKTINPLDREVYGVDWTSTVDVKIEEFNTDSDVVAQMPALMVHKDQSWNYLEIAGGDLKTVVFRFYESLEDGNVGVLYDHPIIASRVIIDSILNATYGYYDNLRFTPSIESVYVYCYPGLYTITSQLFGVGLNFIEFTELFQKYRSSLLNFRRLMVDEEVDESVGLDYIENVLSTLWNLGSLYSRPTHKKYIKNRALSRLACGGIYQNIHRLVNLVGYTGFDVQTNKQHLFNFDLHRLPIAKEHGTGIVNLGIGCIGLSAFLSENSIDQLIENLKYHKTGAQVVLNNIYGEQSQVFLAETGRTYRLSKGGSVPKTMFESVTGIDSSLGGIQTSIQVSQLEGLLHSLAHSPHYFMLTGDKFELFNWNYTGKLCSESLRSLVWSLFRGMSILQSYRAITEAQSLNLNILNTLYRPLLSQGASVDIYTGEAFEYHTLVSNYIRCITKGIGYTAASKAYNMATNISKTESLLFIDRMLAFYTCNRQLLYTIGALYNLVAGVAALVGAWDADKIAEYLENEYSKFSLTQSEWVIFCNHVIQSVKDGTLYTNPEIASFANQLTETFYGKLKTVTLQKCLSLLNEEIVSGDSLAMGRVLQAGGRGMFLRHSLVYRHGVTNKLMYTNGIINAEIMVEKAFSANVACISELNGYPSVFSPIIKRV